MQGSGAARADRMFHLGGEERIGTECLCFFEKGRIKPAAGDNREPVASCRGSPDADISAKAPGDFFERDACRCRRSQGTSASQIGKTEQFCEGIVHAFGRVIEIRVHDIEVHLRKRAGAASGSQCGPVSAVTGFQSGVWWTTSISARLRTACLTTYGCRIQCARHPCRSPGCLRPRGRSSRHRTPRQERAGQAASISCNEGTHVHSYSIVIAGKIIISHILLHSNKDILIIH